MGLAVLLLTLRGTTGRFFGGSAVGSAGQAAIVAAFGLAFWLASGRLLLRGARSWRELLPAAATLAGASVAVSLGSSLLMPEILAGNTARFGVIGAVFSLLSLFVVDAYVLCSATVLGAVLSDHCRRTPAAPPDAGAPRPAG